MSASPFKKKHVIIWSIIVIMLILATCCVPIFIYRNQFDLPIKSKETSDWGTFGDYLGGILNPFISLMTLIATTCIALLLYNYESKRDKQNQFDTDVRSFMELYQFFISDEFYQVRLIAWYMFKKAVSNDSYKNFLVGENYVSRYIERMPRVQVYNEFKDLLYQNDHPRSASPKNEKDFVEQEQDDRNKIDTLVNFFSADFFEKHPQKLL